MRRAFTLVEIVCAVFILGLMSTMAFMTAGAVTRGWEISTDYADKMQRTDYALGLVVSSLRSMYYPCAGSQSYDHGFLLVDNGDGDSPRNSDVVEWSRLASLGGAEKTLTSVHRVQLMVLEEGDTSWGPRPIEATGLYMRRRADSALAPKSEAGRDEYGFSEKDLYEPVLVADGIVGFNCRVMKEAPSDAGLDAAYQKTDFEDTWAASNAVPYKVELTFRMADEDGRSSRQCAPVMRVVRIPIHEQSLDGAATPGSQQASGRQLRRGGRVGTGSGRGGPGGGGRGPGGGGGPGGGAR